MANGSGRNIIFNSETIDRVALKLQNANNSIIIEFENLKKTASLLDENWRSDAGEKACSTIHEIFKVGEARSTVMSNYIRILNQLINPNYVSSEKTNKSLADSFK